MTDRHPFRPPFRSRFYTPFCTLFCTPFCTTLTLLTASLAAQDLPEAKAVLAEMRKKTAGNLAPLEIGGEVRAFWVTSERASPLARSTFVEHHDKARGLFETRIPGVGRLLLGTNPDRTWSLDPVAGPALRTGSDATATRAVLAMFAGHPDASRYKAARTVRKMKRDGRDCWVLVMSRTSGKPDRWYVDCKTGLLQRAELHCRSTINQESRWEVELADWKPRSEGGPMFPHRRSFQEGHFKMVLQVKGIKNLKAQPQLFTMDKELRAAAEKFAALRGASKTDNNTDSKPTAVRAPIIRVVSVPKQHALCIRTQIKPSEISLTIGKLLTELMGHVYQKGASPTGAPFTRYYSFSKDKVDFEAGIPVARPIEGKGKIKAVVLPAGDAAITWHVGPYHLLTHTYTRLKKWVKDQGLEGNGPSREIYWTDPGLEPNPNRWRTEVIQPVKKARQKKSGR